MPRDTFEDDIRRADRDLRSRQFARPCSGWTLAVKRGRDGRSARGSSGGHVNVDE